MQAVAIAGQKKSGKTALTALVADALERMGKRVAIVKYSNHDIEKSNTDAFWLMRGKRTVVNASPEETVFLWSEQLSFERIVEKLDAEVLLLEGNSAPPSIPRILCSKESGEDDSACPQGLESIVLIATHGECSPELGVPHFSEMDPLAAENIAGLILEKGMKV